MAVCLCILHVVRSSSCPIGKSCNPKIKNCGPGQYSALGDTECRIPGPGYTSTLKKDTVVLCPAEKPFSDLSKGIGCSPCPEDYLCERAKIVHCPAGFFSNVGENNCSPCPIGILENNAFDTRCNRQGANLHFSESCEPGKYLEGKECRRCPAGKYCLGIPPLAIDCPEGWYSFENQRLCTLCPAGSFCPSKTQNPIACSLGYYSLEGYTKCIICPPGFSCSAKDSLPFQCPKASYSQTGSSQCLPCPAGMFCRKPSSLPQPCLAGKCSKEGEGICSPCPRKKTNNTTKVVKNKNNLNSVDVRPYQIVKWENEELKIQKEEMRKFMEEMNNTLDIIGISALGRTRSGKSTGMNIAVREIIKIPHEQFQVVHGYQSSTQGIFIDVYSSDQVKEEYSFLNKGDKTKILFIDVEGTKQDGTIEAEMISLVSVILSTNCFIHCDKTHYADISTMNKIVNLIQESKLIKFFKDKHFSILIKGSVPPSDIESEKNEINNKFDMLPSSSVHFIPPPISVLHAANETSDFSKAMEEAIKDSLSEKNAPMPYTDWKEAFDVAIYGINVIPGFLKFPNRPILIKEKVMQLSRTFAHSIPSPKKYQALENIIDLSITLYSKLQLIPEKFPSLWDKYKALAQIVVKQQQKINELFKEMTDSISSLERQKLNENNGKTIAIFSSVISQFIEIILKNTGKMKKVFGDVVKYFVEENLVASENENVYEIMQQQIWSLLKVLLRGIITLNLDGKKICKIVEGKLSSQLQKGHGSEFGNIKEIILKLNETTNFNNKQEFSFLFEIVSENSTFFKRNSGIISNIIKYGVSTIGTFFGIGIGNLISSIVALITEGISISNQLDNVSRSCQNYIVIFNLFKRTMMEMATQNQKSWLAKLSTETKAILNIL